MKKFPLIIIIMIFVGGLGLLLYPVVSDTLNRLTSYVVIDNYDESVKEIDTKEMELKKQQANEYNLQLAKSTFNKTEFKNNNNDDLLAINGIIGYIEIPKISVYLPIYETTDELSLQKGVCHLENTSLPVGGSNTHTVLSGHTGLPSAELLTDLDQLEVEDVFYFHILNENYAYQVDQIKVVLPNQAEDLQITQDKDYATLLTCTPYGINDHRLLVRGTRIPYHVQQDMKSVKDKVNHYSYAVMLFAVIGIVFIILVIVFIIKKLRRGNK